MAKTGKQFTSAVVVTVLNESDSIDSLILALSKQTQKPSEIVIVDGGSSDDTWIKLLGWVKKIHYLKVFQLPRSNRSQGRNFGVAKTHSHLIAFTDAGCIPERNWLQEIIRPFSDSEVTIVSGYYTGLAENVFQKCLIPYVLVMPDVAEKGEFLPSSRSMAMTRSVWNSSGGFDPRLSHNEDYAYANWLKQFGFSFYFSPKAIVKWLPRKDLFQSAIMFFRFAMGDIQAGLLRPKVKFLLIRYLVFIYLIALALKIQPLFYLVFLIVFIYLVWSVSKNFRYVKHPLAFIWLPLLQITSDLSVIWGTIIGVLSKAYGLF